MLKKMQLRKFVPGETAAVMESLLLPRWESALRGMRDDDGYRCRRDRHSNALCPFIVPAETEGAFTIWK